MPSIRTFIARLSEPNLLREFFKRHHIELDAYVADNSLASVVQTIEEQLASKPAGSRGALSNDIERVEKLASEYGEVAIGSVTIHEGLSELPSRLAAALYVFLYDQSGYRRAEEVIYSDSKRGGREWTGFVAQKNLVLGRDEGALQAFKETLRKHFDTRHVYVDIFERTRPGFVDDEDRDGETDARLTQLTVYREDRPNTELEFVDDDGTLATQVRRRVLEAAMTYEPATGHIECVGTHRESRAEMARILATTVLGCAPDFEPVPLRAYDLSVLSQRLGFGHDPEDGIEDVRVSMLRLTPLETVTERVTLETIPPGEKDIWAVADDRLGVGVLGRDYRIDQARIVIRYRTPESNRARSLPIIITHPHRSNIKDRTEIERVVANKYLPRWGLVAAA